MKMARLKNKTNTKGQSLVEVLTATALFVAGVAVIAFLIFGAFASFRQSMETTKGLYLAEEGMAALYAIRDEDFDSLTPGTYGLSLLSGTWQLASTSDVTDGFTRTVTIIDVEDKVKKIESTVFWNVNTVRRSTTTLTGYATDFRQTEGDGAHLNIDISGATLSASSTDLLGLVLENTGGTGISITDIEAQWNNANLLYEIRIDGTDVFSVATSSGVSSGTAIDITDVVLASGSGPKALNHFSWDASVNGTDFLFTFILGDGSRKHVLVDI